MNTSPIAAPWTVDAKEDSFDSRLNLVRIIEKGSESHPQGPLCIAQVNQNLGKQAFVISDLIAAAPDMLEALAYAESILSLIPAFGDGIGDKVSKAQLAVALNKAQQAIAKAKGNA